MIKFGDIIDLLRGNPIELSIDIGDDEPLIENIFARLDAVKYQNCIVKNIFGNENAYGEPCLYIELDGRGLKK